MYSRTVKISHKISNPYIERFVVCWEVQIGVYQDLRAHMRFKRLPPQVFQFVMWKKPPNFKTNQLWMGILDYTVAIHLEFSAILDKS